MQSKERYREFCKREYIPLFSQAWWLDAVAGDDWGVVLYEKNGVIWGSMPYIIKKKALFRAVAQPKLTQQLGPYIKYPQNQRYYKKLSWEKEVISALINDLPKFDYFKQGFHYSITNWLPFFWHGFEQTTYYTYIIDPIEDIEEFWKNSLQKKARVAIKKARNLVDVVESDSAESFYEMVAMTYARQGLNVPYTKELFLKLDRACKEQESRKILFAIDKESREIHVGLYMVYDESTIYLLASGANPSLRSSGAENLLEWSAIEFATKKKKILDFEGSMIEPIESHARSFGFKQMPFFLVTKSNSKLLNLIKCIME